MGKQLTRIAVLGATALVLGLIAAPAAHAQAAVTCLDLVTFTEEPATIVGTNGSSPDHNRQALDLIVSGAVPVADLITHRLPLEQAVEGLHTAAGGEAIKVTI